MTKAFDLNAGVELGVVPTHLKFVGGLVPEDGGRIPRGEDGALKVVSEMKHLLEVSPVKMSSVQVPCFPGIHAGDMDELMQGLQGLGLKVHFILMVGGADPIKAEDEDALVAMLLESVEVAKKYGVEHVASTSAEEWMQPGAMPQEGEAFEAAVAQVAKVHARVYEEGKMEESGIKAWHLEFLRPGEFQTFTSLPKIWKLAQAINAGIGSKFFKVMVDAAHCGDSGLSLAENQECVKGLAESGELGLFHASTKTTRGCVCTDDGWIAALLRSMAKTDQLQQVFVEIFHHEDPALEGLRALEAGHGHDTRGGRSYSEMVIDGVVDVARRLNGLKLRGMLR